MKRRREKLELDEDTLTQCMQLFYDHLKGGKLLSRPKMMALLEDEGIEAKGQRGYHMLLYASLTGLTCIGPVEGKQQTFTLLEEWAPSSKELSEEDALKEITWRYFRSHGPATLHDFAWWTGLKITDARKAIKMTASKLTSETFEKREYWMTKNTSKHATKNPSRVHLLPGFDEYLLGYKDRRAVLKEEHASKVVPGNNGMFMPIIVIDGEVVGTWKRNIKKHTIDVTIHPFTTLDISKDLIKDAAERYSDFIGLPLSAMNIEK